MDEDRLNSLWKNQKLKKTSRRTTPSVDRSQDDFSDILIESREEAEDVLEYLRALVSRYKIATVNDFYDLVGISVEFANEKWGWCDLQSASIRADRGGYLLNLPHAQPIEL
jgi:hypothetical protein